MNSTENNMEQLFLEAYDEYADAIFRHCTLRMGNREKGKDLMQDTFMKAWEYISKDKHIGNMRAFLYKVANNLIIDNVRKRNVRKEDSLEALQEKGFDLHDAKQSPIREYEGKTIVETIQKIEEPYRTALTMRYVDDLTIGEISDVVGISDNATSVRIHRGLKQLTSILT
ncbi:RNA polymerase sigma factor [Candidatus Peribacteria bacterium]|jgi:RNA polymerase sigma-70 factor, ECF subfamily|nr:RNA polymerase sigma factor [Candidatus Peribacteria bacterium]MBT4020908.1 RNA polymerase sigma factor [Candidatus Peribacteria bacterium]MBT4240650.1 RNA polymerase sigma factor [Candidatus Peribacteria bacterium]